MTMPDFQSVMQPLLELAKAGAEHKTSDAISSLADHFELSPEQRVEMLPGGSQRRFNNRVYWAAAHLRAAGLLSSSGHGQFAITDRGRIALTSGPKDLNMKYLAQFPEWVAFKTGDASGGATPAQTAQPEDAAATQTPLEQIQALYAEMTNDWAGQVLASLKDASPPRFERIVVEVLFALGYAGTKGQPLHLGGACDDGVDGVVTQDHFGFERVYVQAKRYVDQAVDAHAIRDFIGALDIKGATKGVFMTTSAFTKDARAVPTKLMGKQIILLDGQQMAKLMVEHGVGMTDTGEKFVMRSLDNSYFEDQ